MKSMYPILALWAHPRSMSTATERIMRERGDLDCLHEPFIYHYYVGRGVRSLPHFERDPGQPVNYPDIRDKILNSAETGQVFFKDMSFYALEEMRADPEFGRRLNHTFLIRNPRDALASYYELDPDLTLEEIGLESQWLHFQYLEQVTGKSPLVVEAETIRADPRSALARIWAWQGLNYVEEAFDWRTSTVPEDWRQVEGWHGSVLGSGGIEGSKSPESGAERFERCCTSAPHLREYLAHHTPYYQALRERAVSL